MSVYLSPIGNDQQLDSNGNPLVGGYWEVYAAGTTTPVTTYTSSDGLTPQPASIVLDASGRPANPIWLTGGTPVKFRLSSASAVVLLTIDNVSGINDPAGSAVSLSEWLASGFTPTYLSATSFSVPGDQTASLQVGRRIRTTNTGGTVYSTILTSVYGAVTTVTVENDSSVLDSGLSVLSYGIISKVNSSAPMLTRGTSVATTSGTSIDFTSIPVWAKRITVMLNQVSTSGTSPLIVRVGTSSGIVTTNYRTAVNLNANVATSTSGFLLEFSRTSNLNETDGMLILTAQGNAGLSWQGIGNTARSTDGAVPVFAGSSYLSGVLDRIRLTTVGGADTFDNGSVNILYE